MAAICSGVLPRPKTTSGNPWRSSRWWSTRANRGPGTAARVDELQHLLGGGLGGDLAGRVPGPAIAASRPTCRDWSIICGRFAAGFAHRMTPSDTIILVSYFFVLSILAVYGWHRYYLVYLYMRHKESQPVEPAPLDPLPVVTVQLPIYNEMYVADRLIDAVCRLDYPRELLEIQVLDDSTDETCEIAELAVRRHAAQGIDIKYFHRTDRTGYKAGALEAGLKVARGSYIAHLRRRLPAGRRLPPPAAAAFRRSEGRHGAGALGAHQPGLLAAHEDSVDPARRPLRARARRPQSRRPLLQFQRHGRHVAPRGDRRRRRLAARHADRRSRPELSRAAARLEVRVPARRRGAGGSAGRDERVQVAAAPLGEGLDSDLQEAAAADSAGRSAAAGQGRSVLPPDGEFQLPADDGAVRPHVPVDGDPLRDGLVRDAAHRRAAVFRGDDVVLQFLHRVPAGDSHGLGHAAPLHAVSDFDRHRPVREQHEGGARGALRQEDASSRGRRNIASKATATSG